MRHMTKLHQRGDTIVEVLIAITIVSLILGGAYVTSRNSLDATQDTQEHLDALQLTQAQIELVRSLATTSSPVFTTPTPFCIYDSAGAVTYRTTTVACTVNSNGVVSGTPGSSAPYIYREEILNRSGNGKGPYTFTAQTSWPSVQNNTDRVQLIYRIYE